MKPKTSSLATLSNEALCKLRDEVAILLNTRAEELQKEADRLRNGTVASRKQINGLLRRVHNASRKKIAPKYIGPKGDTWTGRGKTPRWLKEAMVEGKTPDDFLINGGRSNDLGRADKTIFGSEAQLT